MIVQIYEISTAQEAQQIAETGADHVGILVGNGDFPREIAINDAGQILDAIPRPAKKLVLTLSRDTQAIAKIIRELQPDIVHLGTVPEGISPLDVEAFKKDFPQVKIMRSIPVTGMESVDIAK